MGFSEGKRGTSRPQGPSLKFSEILDEELSIKDVIVS